MNSTESLDKVYLDSRLPAFMMKVDKTHECWIWIASNDGRYGLFRLLDKLEKAHRVSYMLFKGEIGPFDVLHECDNTLCVNPSHLFLGTPKTNAIDRVQKGRCATRKYKGEGHPNAILTEELVRSIDADTKKMTGSAVATKYLISKSTVSAIKRRRVWKHLWTNVT